MYFRGLTQYDVKARMFYAKLLNEGEQGTCLLSHNEHDGAKSARRTKTTKYVEHHGSRWRHVQIIWVFWQGHLLPLELARFNTPWPRMIIVVITTSVELIESQQAHHPTANDSGYGLWLPKASVHSVARGLRTPQGLCRRQIRITLCGWKRFCHLLPRWIASTTHIRNHGFVWIFPCCINHESDDH